jgi:hypothetical protein
MMWSLRKGHDSIYTMHEHTGHSLGAEKFECGIVDGKAIFSLSIRPISSHQKSDERYLHEEKLVYLTVDNIATIEGLGRHLGSFDNWELQLVSQGKVLHFTVVPDFESDSHGLKLDVVN